jgi:hypothetical protein
MNKPTTRRNFLAVAGGSAAAVGLGAAAASAAEAKPVEPPREANGPLVAYVTDMQDGEVTLMHGEEERVVHDRDLAARLARAAHAKKS